MMIDSSPPHGFSPYGHGTFVPVQTTYKPSAVFWIFEGERKNSLRRGKWKNLHFGKVLSENRSASR